MTPGSRVAGSNPVAVCVRTFKPVRAFLQVHGRSRCVKWHRQGRDAAVDKSSFMRLGGIYAIVAYIAFVFANLWGFLFLGNFRIEHTVDAQPHVAPLLAALIDAGLLGLFALQHSLMARPSFKRWWGSVAPPEINRSTYVLLASVLLFAVFGFWQPIAGTLWSVSEPLSTVVNLLYVCGWFLMLGSTFLIDHAQLFGISRIFSPSSAASEVQFRTPGLYRLVRHPMMFGFVVLFWASPTMTIGHMLFAVLSTAYILVGTWFEERDLVVALGARYVEYRKRVPMLLPRLGKKQ